MVEPLNILIVGAGVASLTAARELLSKPSSIIESVTIVEALGYVGGRITSSDDFIPGGHRIDLGAEYIHGFGTLLTQVVDEKKAEWKETILDAESDVLEDIFIVAHADGGPQKMPTKDGKYGVYYLAGEDKLLRYDTDDEDFCQLTDALSRLEYDSENDDHITKSLGEYLEESISIPDRMIGIMQAGFGNTAGCTDLHKISLSATADFETHWEENEIEGDARLHSRIGMVGIIDALVDTLKQDDRFNIHLNWTVQRVEWGQNVRVVSTKGDGIVTDKIIITAPPPIITSNQIQFDPPLPQWKLDSYNMVGMERAIKVLLCFKSRFWPKNVQNVIVANMNIPEIWFREMSWKDESGVEAHAYVAVGFLTSKSADDLKIMLGNRSDQDRRDLAADIMKVELASIFKIANEVVDEAFQSCILFDWGDVESIRGGYIYPKVGITKNDFHLMAKSIDDVLYWAGEATNTNACCTIQSAMETGVRVAEEITYDHISFTCR
jgi:monoamine oxidase